VVVQRMGKFQRVAGVEGSTPKDVMMLLPVTQ
jgi:hypothetical protein